MLKEEQILACLKIQDPNGDDSYDELAVRQVTYYLNGLGVDEDMIYDMAIYELYDFAKFVWGMPK